VRFHGSVEFLTAAVVLSLLLCTGCRSKSPRDRCGFPLDADECRVDGGRCSIGALCTCPCPDKLSCLDFRPVDPHWNGLATSVIAIESPALYHARREPSFESATARTVLWLTATGGATSRIRAPVDTFQR